MLNQYQSALDPEVQDSGKDREVITPSQVGAGITTPIKQTQLSNLAIVQKGVIQEVFANYRAYRVALDGGTVIICTYIAQAGGFWAAQDQTVLGRGATVWVVRIPGAHYGTIIGVQPDILTYEGQTIKGRLLKDTDYILGDDYSIPNKDSFHKTLNMAGVPLWDFLHDCPIAGEWMKRTPTGMTVFLNSFLAGIQSGNDHGIWVNYLDDFVRISARNYEQIIPGKTDEQGKYTINARHCIYSDRDDVISLEQYGREIDPITGYYTGRPQTEIVKGTSVGPSVRYKDASINLTSSGVIVSGTKILIGCNYSGEQFPFFKYFPWESTNYSDPNDKPSIFSGYGDNGDHVLNAINYFLNWDILKGYLNYPKRVEWRYRNIPAAFIFMDRNNIHLCTGYNALTLAEPVPFLDAGGLYITCTGANIISEYIAVSAYSLGISSVNIRAFSHDYISLYSKRSTSECQILLDTTVHIYSSRPYEESTIDIPDLTADYIYAENFEARWASLSERGATVLHRAWAPNGITEADPGEILDPRGYYYMYPRIYTGEVFKYAPTLNRPRTTVDLPDVYYGSPFSGFKMPDVNPEGGQIL